jgi:hypothetical protein
MEKDIERALWEELKILQTIIDKFDGFSFQIKNWFLAIFAAITGYAVVNNDTILLWINFLIIITCYIYEIIYRIKHMNFLERSREIQKWLRENNDVKNDIETPYLEKYSDEDIFLNLTITYDKNLLYLYLYHYHQ